MIKKITAPLLTLVLMTVFFLPLVPVHAQTTESVIVTRESLDADLAELRRSYRGQLEEYRVRQQQFVVAQSEFHQLSTLSSLEVAVQATKQTMIMRDMVIQTYLRIVELEILSAEGVDSRLKESSLAYLDAAQKAMTRHLEQTQTTTDRDGIEARANEFELLLDELTFTTTFTRTTLQLSQIRAVYDKAEALLLGSPINLPNNTELQNAQRLRALEQIQQELQRADISLDQIENDLLVSQERQRVSISPNDLEDAYVTMTQALNFLLEVTRAEQV